ncbi:hypothetical protein BDV93DRAFT_521613 [Ceratobasidium sp. AG-I]|nr:hypothetical protein BDV93DRAFT_521613 [Ceratobasidium sp. AG-I]
MNSFLALALAAQAVVANPLVRRQVTSSRATTTVTATAAFTTSIVEFTDTDTILTPTATVTLTDSPTTTAGGSDGSYWFCSFPGSSDPTETSYYSLPEPTYLPTGTLTGSFSEVTGSVTPIETDTVTETDANTDTESLLFKRQATTTRTATASQVTVTSVAETDTFTDVPTETVTIPDSTFPITSDFPTITATATAAPGGWVSTYTIVGPETTAVIECVRVPGRGGYHHHGPHYPPHHGTGPVTWSGPVPTTDVFTFSSIVTDTELPTFTTTVTASVATATTSV